MQELTEDEFISWKHHPVTKVIMDVLSAHISEIKETWLNESWNSGKADQVRLAELKGRSKGIEEIVSLGYADIKASLEWQKANQ